jgi:hypothetical protein
MSDPSEKFSGTSAIPDDDLRRKLVVARPDSDDSLLHLGLVGIRTRSCCAAKTLPGAIA